MGKANGKRSSKRANKGIARDRKPRSGDPRKAAAEASGARQRTSWTDNKTVVPETFWGRVRGRIRLPKRNPWSEFKAATPNHRYAVMAIIMVSITLVAWAMLYFITYLNVGGIRNNDAILAAQIVDGSVVPVKGIGEDGSLVTFDDVPYPPESYETVHPVSRHFEIAYYNPKELSLVAPLDWVSVLKMHAQVIVWFGATLLMYFADMFYTIKLRSGRPYYKQVYETYPLWLRLMRWAIGILMVMTIGNWLLVLL